MLEIVYTGLLVAVFVATAGLAVLGVRSLSVHTSSSVHTPLSIHTSHEGRR